MVRWSGHGAYEAFSYELTGSEKVFAFPILNFALGNVQLHWLTDSKFRMCFEPLNVLFSSCRRNSKIVAKSCVRTTDQYRVKASDRAAGPTQLSEEQSFPFDNELQKPDLTLSKMLHSFMWNVKTVLVPPILPCVNKNLIPLLEMIFAFVSSLEPTIEADFKLILHCCTVTSIA